MKPSATKVEVVEITLDMVTTRKCGNESGREAMLLYFLIERGFSCCHCGIPLSCGGSAPLTP